MNSLYRLELRLSRIGTTMRVQLRIVYVVAMAMFGDVNGLQAGYTNGCSTHDQHEG